MYKKPLIQSLRGQTFETAGIKVDTLRLDLIHPEVSGNKWYKLKYHIAAAIHAGKKGLVSFGGAYSNHLVAMAYACREAGLKATGIVRGEEPEVYGTSLQQMQAFGMELVFVSREEYKYKIISGFDDLHIVPEGGGGELGIKGAAEIMQETNGDYSHIICAVGTGTTIRGIVRAALPGQDIIGVKVLKDQSSITGARMIFDYHFGGYAKKTAELLAFMNSFYKEEHIPTDFVYTGKLFYAVKDLAIKKFFPKSARVLVIHSGGLQGNRSLPAGSLVY